MKAKLIDLVEQLTGQKGDCSNITEYFICGMRKNNGKN